MVPMVALILLVQQWPIVAPDLPAVTAGVKFQMVRPFLAAKVLCVPEGLRALIMSAPWIRLRAQVRVPAQVQVVVLVVRKVVVIAVHHKAVFQ